ncbi:MAG: hypothetical protein ACTSYT_03460 [Candidatus Asgardarchaeia archaeon]
MADWKIVAENELKIMTSRFHRHRKLLVIVLSILASVYFFLVFFYITPLIEDAKMFFLLFPNISVFMVNYITLMAFMMCLLSPIQSTLRESSIPPIEVLLSSPIEVHHILVGSFIPKAFAYSLGSVILLAPFDVILHVVYELDVFRIILVNLVVVALISVSVWISTVTVSIFISKLASTPRGKDIARALNVIMSGILFLLLYLSGFFTGFSDMENFNMSSLEMLPSGWFADIILSILGVDTGIPAELSVLISASFIFASFSIGYRLAERYYTVLTPTSLSVTTIRGENIFYRGVRKLIPGRLGEIVTLNFKQFFRYVESTSSYIFGTLMTIAIPMIIAMSMGVEVPEDMSLLMASMVLTLVIPVFVIITTADITIRGKDKLWIFRKVPSGTKLFVIGKYLQSVMIVIPQIIIIPIVLSTLFKLDLNVLFKAFPSVLLLALGNVAESIGVYCVNPVFSEKSFKFALNSLVIMFLTMFFPIISMVLLSDFFQFDQFQGEASMLFTRYTLYNASLSLLIGSILLWLGIKRLSTIE